MGALEGASQGEDLATVVREDLVQLNFQLEGTEGIKMDWGLPAEKRRQQML